ncbi:hypothetical protein D3C71_786690 [compost metagenome]
MVQHRILQAQLTEPAVRQVQMHFLAQPTFGSDAEAVAHDQHPDQKSRIDGGTAGVAVVRGEMLVQLAQIEELVDTAKQMVRWDVIFEIEGVEQRGLAGFLTSHHRVDFHWIDGKPVDQLQMTDSTEFFNGIGRKRTSGGGGIKHAYRG